MLFSYAFIKIRWQIEQNMQSIRNKYNGEYTHFFAHLCIVYCLGFSHKGTSLKNLIVFLIS
jgi:hypothetical protein